MMGIVTALWGPFPRRPVEGGRLSPEVSPFPSFQMSSRLHVVRVGEDVNYSNRLTLLSLQGLVNRDGVEIYLDIEGGDIDTRSMLDFISERYGIEHDQVEPEWILDTYIHRARGIFVYDPRKPESVNIGTIYAGIENLLIAGPDNAPLLSQTYGLPIIIDYARSTWATLDTIGAYERALEELYPNSFDRLLAILPPEAAAIRDYLVATRTFVFYYPQGPLAAPWEISATKRVLESTPRGIPVIGWFHSPTEMEENAFIQMVSSAGKYFVGAQDTPNLSVLTALGRARSFRQPNRADDPLVLSNRTYAVVAVSDGDNIDFVAGRMAELWRSDVRGTLPITWSLNPLLVELAPPLIEYYYSTATLSDAFVAGPSGAGYIYPDYVGTDDLEPYLQFSRKYLQAADMDIVWLLNAFPAYETPYSDSALSKYVEVLDPRGLVLDYDDQPKTEAYWMVKGGENVSPVVRSTHFWTTEENFLAKVQAAVGCGAGPHFLWITLYPFFHDLSDLKEVTDLLSKRLGERLELVLPETFFALMQRAVQTKALADFRSIKDDPVAPILFPYDVEMARTHLDSSIRASSEGDDATAAYEAYVAVAHLRAAAANRAILLISLSAATIIALALILRRPEPAELRKTSHCIPSMTIVAITSALYFLSLRVALDSNFWTYHFIAIGIAVMGISPRLRQVLSGVTQPLDMSIVGIAFLASTALAFYSSSAFPLVAVTALLLVDSSLRRRPLPPGSLLTSLLLGLALGHLLSPTLPAFTILSLLLVASILVLPPKARANPETKRKGAWITGLMASLPLVALLPSHYHTIALRLDIAPASLVLLGGITLVLSSLLAASVRRLVSEAESTVLQILPLGLAVPMAILLLMSRGTAPVALLLLALAAVLTVAAHGRFEEYASSGGSPLPMVRTTLTLASLFLFFQRLPPIAYSLLLFPLPEWMEYALYAPQITYVAIFIAVLAFLVVRWLEAANLKRTLKKHK